MRSSLLTVAGGILASLLFAGTVHAGTAARPGFPPALAKSPIYGTGKLPLQQCEEQPVQRQDLDGARVYLEFLLECLNKSWGPQVKKAGFAFAPPKFEAIAKPGRRTTCGAFPQEAQAIYCPKDRKITFLLSPAILEQPTELFLMQVMAHEYGHHIQQLTGMFKVVHRFKGKSEARILEEIRRSELQAECLSGAFIGRIWHSLGRHDSDFDHIVRTAQEGSNPVVAKVLKRDLDNPTHGRAANIAWWLRRGFDAESPGACNTWTAPASRVA